MNKYTTKKQNIYGEYSKTYDEDRRLMVGDRALSSRMDWAFFNLHAGHNLLDLGCGTGGLLLRASTILGETDIACGLDISPDMLSIAKKKLCAHHIGLIQADVAHALPIQNNLFDLVTGLNLLQEIPPSHYMEVFKEIYRVLKLGGWFRGIVPCVMDNSEPNSVFSEEARNRADMHFHPWYEIDELFQKSEFKHIEVTLRSSSASRSAARGEPKFKLFSQIMEAVRNRGLNPNDVREPVLLLSGRKD